MDTIIKSRKCLMYDAIEGNVDGLTAKGKRKMHDIREKGKYRVPKNEIQVIEKKREYFGK